MALLVHSWAIPGVMLSEVEKVPQDWRSPGSRRWFADDEMDLIVWYAESGAINGFQLCYDVRGNERAFTWRQGADLKHTAIESGEESPLYNRSPLLVSCPAIGTDKVIADFEARSQPLDKVIVEMVLEKLKSFGEGSPESTR